MKNVLEIEKKNAVREFAEKLKNVIHERDYVQGYAEIGRKNLRKIYKERCSQFKKEEKEQKVKLKQKKEK